MCLEKALVPGEGEGRHPIPLALPGPAAEAVFTITFVGSRNTCTRCSSKPRVKFSCYFSLPAAAQPGSDSAARALRIPARLLDPPLRIPKGNSRTPEAALLIFKH